MTYFEDPIQPSPEPFSGYRGPQASFQHSMDLPGQKLQLNEEISSRLHDGRPWYANQRLLLALVSLTLITILCALLIVGIAFGHISPQGAPALGYKVHFTQTCDEDAPQLITHVETTRAGVNDVRALPSIHANLARDRSAS
jgi:hypothetical protein